MKTVNWVLSTALTLVMAVGVMAADEAKKPEKAKGKGKAAPSVVQLPKEVELTAEQKEKIAAINKEFAPKLAEANKKLESILSEDQRKARAEALKKAREEGKKGKEAAESVAAATKITDDQKVKFEEAQKAVATIRKEALEKAAAVLTDEQKAKVPQLAARKGGKAAKKPGDAPKKSDAPKKEKAAKAS